MSYKPCPRKDCSYQEKGEAIDPISLDTIPPERYYTIQTGNKCDCFDIASLYTNIQEGRLVNPSTQLELSPEDLQRINQWGIDNGLDPLKMFQAPKAPTRSFAPIAEPVSRSGLFGPGGSAFGGSAFGGGGLFGPGGSAFDWTTYNPGGESLFGAPVAKSAPAYGFLGVPLAPSQARIPQVRLPTIDSQQMNNIIADINRTYRENGVLSIAPSLKYLYEYMGIKIISASDANTALSQLYETIPDRDLFIAIVYPHVYNKGTLPAPIYGPDVQGRLRRYGIHL